MNFKRLLYSDIGKYIISILLGLGLATLFRKSCTKRSCFVFEAPSLKELDSKIYGFDDKCYKFKSKSKKCDSTKKTVEIA